MAKGQWVSLALEMIGRAIYKFTNRFYGLRTTGRKWQKQVCSPLHENITTIECAYNSLQQAVIQLLVLASVQTGARLEPA